MLKSVLSVVAPLAAYVALLAEVEVTAAADLAVIEWLFIEDIVVAQITDSGHSQGGK